MNDSRGYLYYHGAMIPIDIFLATPEHLGTWTQFARKLFFETFEHSITSENMQHYLDTEMTEPIFASQLANPQYKTFYVFVEKELAGYIQFYFNLKESYQNISLELKRFYVAPHLHGKGVAGQMMSFCFQEAARMNESALWLGVWENNFKALAFYKKWGYEPISEHTFVTGSESQRDLILARQIPLNGL